ncbi:MAG TPA: hypothetical protein VK564_11105 [Thermodesulfobacteriota bacterium]|nr:hypothetical protein [Thermodesulfobacteriota bacterium]
MKLWLILGLALLSIFNAQEWIPAADLLPSLQLSKTDFDLGDVAENSVVSHEFTVANTGAGVLKIISVEPG